MNHTNESTMQHSMPPEIAEILRQFQIEEKKNVAEQEAQEDAQTTANTESSELIDQININSENANKKSTLLQIRSDSYSDFINIQPRFFEKWGIAMIAIIIAMGLLACCFIKYPEIVRGNIKVQSENAPKA